MADQDSREGKRYQTPAIIKYVNDTHAGHDGALAQAFATPEGIPAIQVGPSEGRLLHLLLRLAGARKVVEVGTLVGYSAIHMARALARGGARRAADARGRGAVRRGVHRRRQGELRSLRPVGARAPAPGRAGDRRQR